MTLDRNCKPWGKKKSTEFTELGEFLLKIVPFFMGWDLCVTLKHTGSTGKFENSKSFFFFLLIVSLRKFPFRKQQ